MVDLDPLRDADPELCRRFVDLRHRIEAAEHAGATIDDPAVAEAAEGLETTITRIRQLPGLHDFLRRPTLESLAAGLTADEAIAYPVIAPRGAAWLLLRNAPGRSPVTSVELPDVTSGGVFESLARPDPTIRMASTDSYLVQQADPCARHLGAAVRQVESELGPTLMRPLASALREAGTASVCIVAVGLLGLVPLHALAWQDDDGSEHCLLDVLDVSFAPSGYARQICHDRAARRPGFACLVAVGNPLPQSPPLPHAEREARLVATLLPADRRVLLLREAATKQKVLDAMPLASHLHLACHGQAAGDARAFDAALYFAGDEPVAAAELLELDLSRARLVVASACETGVVPSYELADEALALSTVFLGAGAAGAIASLWSVNDYATALLMTRFYEHLVANPDDVAGALRNAQLWLRDLSAFDEAAYAARHPRLTAQRTRHATRASSPDDSAAAGSAGFGCPTMWAAFVFTGA